MTRLTRQQKEAIGLLQIGTFLEYFDLMLYVHMAVLLNELFFPKTDVHTASLLTAFAFCSTYVLRPFGALFFGYIGDNIGRKTTVILTTTMMAISCMIMANLPTYAQIGVTAAWVVTACRMVQGLSSLGEIMGAEIYVTEITKPPHQYPAVSFISIASNFGSLAALCVAALATHYGFNWRMAFWIGACIALVGSVARTRLRETPEFLALKEKIKRARSEQVNNISGTKKLPKMRHQEDWKEKIPYSTSFYYFLVYCGWPLTFYLAYMYFIPVLKTKFGYSPEDIISHNLWVAFVTIFVAIGWSWMSYYIYPLKILKVRGFMALILMALLPFLLEVSSSPIHIFILQTLILSLHLGGVPADSIFIKRFPVYRRFTATTFLYALTRAVMYIITSFGVIYLTEWFGFYGILIITIPICIGFLAGVYHFEKLEKSSPQSVFTPAELTHDQAAA
ncbi:MFS transporter [Candidatus Finniella inopinata]|uniref:MFS transporter n=1 Tax=Candidatus Finniella inopinata TaxID=1696036 RepID=A0A4Q7DIC7_9PROT|nr:MFS transporter [Candidatus Finniella inopinata]RZI46462.1 MFS transporter [Candidatus Finniella inopinata]